MRKLSATTFYGSLAGSMFACAQVGWFPHWIQGIFMISGGIGIALLGIHSTDCPRNCPGTDAAGNRIQPDVKVRTRFLPSILLPLALIAMAPLLTSCSALSPAGLAQLKDDHNSFDLDVQTLYGHGHILRIGTLPGMTMSKSSDGNLTVTYPAATNLPAVPQPPTNQVPTAPTSPSP